MTSPLKTRTDGPGNGSQHFGGRKCWASGSASGVQCALPSLQPQLTDYYYYWKKTSAGLSSRSTRRQRKQAHIRMSRAAVKLREVCSDREYGEERTGSADSSCQATSPSPLLSAQWN